jgi:hypothetical protein
MVLQSKQRIAPGAEKKMIVCSPELLTAYCAKTPPRLYEPLRRVARVVVDEASQDLSPLHFALSWLVVGFFCPIP